MVRRARENNQRDGRLRLKIFELERRPRKYRKKTSLRAKWEESINLIKSFANRKFNQRDQLKKRFIVWTWVGAWSESEIIINRVRQINGNSIKFGAGFEKLVIYFGGVAGLDQTKKYEKEIKVLKIESLVLRGAGEFGWLE